MAEKMGVSHLFLQWKTVQSIQQIPFRKQKVSNSMDWEVWHL